MATMKNIHHVLYILRNIGQNLGGGGGQADQQAKVLEQGGEGGEQVEEEDFLVQEGRILHCNVLPLHPRLCAS